MTLNEEMKSYARELKIFSVPLVQKKFKCDYLTARNFADGMVESGEAEFDGVIMYKCVWARFEPRESRTYAGRDFCGIDPKLFISALEKCIDRNECSISSLRRVSCTDLSTACALLNAFVEKGYVSTAQGAKKREILISKRRFLVLYGDLILKFHEEQFENDEEDEEDEDDAFEEITEFINKTDAEEREKTVKSLIAVLKNIALKKSQNGG